MKLRVRAVYKVPLVSDLEIYPFSFTCQVEVILVLGLGVLFQYLIFWSL
jgi:hypothetical protein